MKTNLEICRKCVKANNSLTTEQKTKCVLLFISKHQSFIFEPVEQNIPEDCPYKLEHVLINEQNTAKQRDM